MNTGSSTHKDDPDTSPGVREAYRLVMVEIEQLRKEQHDLKTRLEKAEAARDLLRQLLVSKGEVIDGQASDLAETSYGKKGTRHRKGSQTGEVVTRSREILMSIGRPLERGELFEKIEASGFTITAGNPARFIGRTLWESDDFVHIPKEGYWLKDMDLPKVKRRGP